MQLILLTILLTIESWGEINPSHLLCIVDYYVTVDSFNYKRATKDLIIKMKGNIKHYVLCDLIAF